MRFTRLIPLTAAALLVLSACSSSASTPAPTAAPTAAPSAAASAGGGAAGAVAIKNFKFDPATATAKIGGSVTWTNGDSTAHTVTFDDPSMTSSGDINAAGTFSATFAAAGTYAYHCKIHPTMTGTVTVS